MVQYLACCSENSFMHVYIHSLAEVIPGFKRRIYTDNTAQKRLTVQAEGDSRNAIVYLGV